MLKPFHLFLTFEVVGRRTPVHHEFQLYTVRLKWQPRYKCCFEVPQYFLNWSPSGKLFDLDLPVFCSIERLLYKNQQTVDWGLSSIIQPKVAPPHDGQPCSFIQHLCLWPYQSLRQQSNERRWPRWSAWW